MWNFSDWLYIYESDAQCWCFIDRNRLCFHEFIIYRTVAGQHKVVGHCEKTQIIAVCVICV